MQNERRFLAITMLLLALIGAPAVYSVAREPKAKVAKDEMSPLTLKRTLASVTPAKVIERARRNFIKSKSVVLDYSCKELGKPHEVDASLLRLRGDSCLEPTWKNISITNQSNGHTASVIFLKDKKFTTDFIDLKEGENKLTIQATDEQGQAIHQEFRIQRRAPAAVEEESDLEF